MTGGQKNAVAGLLTEHIDRDVILAIEEGFIAAALRANRSAEGVGPEFKSRVLGYGRHFCLNEVFYNVLKSHGLPCIDPRSSGVVIGQSGIWQMARFVTHDDTWSSGRRSKTRLSLALKNWQVESLVYGDLFDDNDSPTEGTVFFVSSFSANPDFQPEKPLDTYIAVCDHEMKQWVFVESLNIFVNRYSVSYEASKQLDLAKPKLKKQGRKSGTQ